jgi:formylglycine-generating enzyme required for sulfatase activity
MTIVANYASRSGYRLPTEAEWEYACRANAQTAWSCGQVDAELMSRYAWWYGTSIVNGIQKSSPVGRLKPNDFGLFDMHGNAGEWCQEPFRQPKNDVPHLGGIGAEVVKDKVDRAVVEGSFSYPFGNIRSTDRGGLEPGIDVSGIGFRPVRSVR